jgi:hypothetical protein
MKLYVGVGTGTVVGAKSVFVNDKPLRHIEKHSPDGFNWGYGGSGPADLAYAILYDLYGEIFANNFYQRFKHDIIAALDQDKGWVLTEARINEWQDREMNLHIGISGRC